MTKHMTLKFTRAAALTFIAALAATATTAAESTHDAFVEIVKGEKVLEAIYDKGDVCEFKILGKSKGYDSDKAVEKLTKKISKLYDTEPVTRGDTLAWSFENTGPKTRQADHVNVLIMKTSDGSYRLKLDRRKGETRNNTRTEPTSTPTSRVARRSVSVLPVTPPPGLVD